MRAHSCVFPWITLFEVGGAFGVLLGSGVVDDVLVGESGLTVARDFS